MNQWALNINSNSHQAPCIWSEEEITMFALYYFVLHMHVKADQRCSWHKNKGSSIIDCFLAGCFPNDYVGLVVKLWRHSVTWKDWGKGNKKNAFLSVCLQCEDAVKLEGGMEYKSLSNGQKETQWSNYLSMPIVVRLKKGQWNHLHTCTLKIAPVPKINMQLE